MARLLDILLSTGMSLDDLGSLHIRRGETLITQGAESHAVYFVLAGRFRVERNGETVGHIEAGSVVGEIGFFTGATRTASVIAYRDSLALRLTREAYESHCARLPDLREAIIAELASRLADRYRGADTRTASNTRPRTLCLMAAGGAPVPERFTDMLMTALAPLADARLITLDIFRSSSGNLPPDSAAATDWFSRTERRAGLTLYLAEGGDDWQQACVRQSDQVLLVTPPGAPLPLSPGERFALTQTSPDQRRLVLLHRRRRPLVAGTRDWLRSRPASMHHHVTLRDTADVARLARFLAGSAVGLVLSGGGAYGMAHVGVHTGLYRAGLRFDVYGGTSVGAAMAAAFALGLAPHDVTRRTGDIFLRSGSLRRVTLPRYALLDHRRFDAKLAEHFGSTDIADMWLPFYAVTTDLTTNRSRTLRTGPLWEAIRASSALPGILPPFIRGDGDLMVDGGLLDNLPYRAMRTIKAGPNVLVSLERARAPEAHYNYARIPGRAGVLLGLLRPGLWREPPAPGIADTIMRSMLAGRTDHARDLWPQDWLLTPPLPDEMSFMNWKAAFGLTGPAEDYARMMLRDLTAHRPDLLEALRLGAESPSPP